MLRGWGWGGFSPHPLPRGEQPPEGLPEAVLMLFLICPNSAGSGVLNARCIFLEACDFGYRLMLCSGLCLTRICAFLARLRAVDSGEGEPTCSGEPRRGAPAAGRSDVKSFNVKNCARALRYVDNLFFWLLINEL